MIDGPIVTIGGRQSGKSRPETPPTPPIGGHPGIAPALAVVDEPRQPAPKPHPGKHRVENAPRRAQTRERIRMVVTDPESGKVVARGDADRQAVEQLARGGSITLGGGVGSFPSYDDMVQISGVVDPTDTMVQARAARAMFRRTGFGR